MPHSTSHSLGVQTFILCGPGEGLNPFNSNPKDFPKALIPIANRPMVWYSLEWCHRAAVSSVVLVTPPECAQALDAALSQNPYLTSLPSVPRTSILSPDDLELTTSTAEIFRLPQVQDAIVGDYIILPCDLICEVSARSLLETWTLLQPPFFDTRQGDVAEKGGLGVWYCTEDASENAVGVKKEETDFLATVDVDKSLIAPSTASYLTLRRRIQEVALAMPMDALKDELREKENFRVRTQLLKKKGRAKVHSSVRDAHIYLMPHWSKEYIRQNETFESFGEDVVGWWGKSRWQTGLDQKLKMDAALRPAKRRKSEGGRTIDVGEEAVDLGALNSTTITHLTFADDETGDKADSSFASRVPQQRKDTSKGTQENHPNLPPMLSYIHPALYTPSDPAPNLNQPASGPKQKPQTKGGQHSAAIKPPSQLIRRVDTVKLLLSCSLYLARLPSIIAALPIPPPGSAHPYCHSQQVHPTSNIPSQATIPTQSVLIDANCTLQPRITIRDSVIGANCSIASGSRLHSCLLMEGVVIEDRVVLSGCVLGRRCKVGPGSELKDCFLQDGYIVSEGTTAKGEMLAGFDEGRGLDEGEEDGLDLGGK